MDQPAQDLPEQNLTWRFRQELAGELRPDRLSRSLLTGVLLFLLDFGVVASFAALIYGKVAPEFLALAIGLVVVGDSVLIVCIALASSYRGSIGIAQDAPTAVLALAAASVAGSMAITASPEATFLTIAATVALVTIASGIFFIILGAFRLGELARFLPYPVMGGFLAGTGWLLVVGGIEIMLPANPETLLATGSLIFWLPGFIIATLLLLLTRRYSTSVVLPIAIIAILAGFYLVAFLLGVTTTDLIEQGWLVGQTMEGGIWRWPLSPDAIEQVDWAAIGSNVAILLPVPLISVIALLLNVGGVELVVKRDFNLNRELRAMGIGNVVAGLAGSIIGYTSVSFSTLNYRLAGGRRLPALIMAGLLLVAAILGAPLIGYIPKLLLGTLVILIGMWLLVEWVYEAWFKFARVDFAIILIILLIIAWRGFLEGILVGLLVALVMFAVSYSRTSIVRNEMHSGDFHSRVLRSPAEQAALQSLCDQIFIMQLQGFIFFGTANGLLNRVRRRVASEPTRFTVIDFARVSGLDSTGLLSFQKMLNVAANDDMTLVLTGVAPAEAERFRRGGFTERTDYLMYFDSLDRGVEWCENQLLAAAAVTKDEALPLAVNLAGLMPKETLDGLLSHMVRRELAEGEYLIRQGDEPDYVFIVEVGQLTAQLESDGGQPIRLETMRGGRTVGEIGFYLGTQRSAAVVADEPSVVRSLSRDDLKELEETDPVAAYAFHRLIIHILSERTLHLTRTVEALQN